MVQIEVFSRDHDLLMRYSLGLNISFGGFRFVPCGNLARSMRPLLWIVDEIGTFVSTRQYGASL